MLKALRTPIATAILFVAGFALLVGGGIGTVQAAPTIVSGDYTAQVELVSIHTELYENGASVGDTILSSVEAPAIGKVYEDELAVHNDGKIPEYVRVIVSKYWVDADGNKQVNLNPAYIDLNFPAGQGWTIDKKVSTDERVVLYYADAVDVDGVTKPFATSLRIDPAVAAAGKSYEGMTFHVDVKVDAVQTHNGQAAMKGAWGRTNS